MVSDDGGATPEAPVSSCPDCRAALESTGRDAVSFLLVDSLTLPVVGCEVHLEQFRLVCGLTSENPARLLSHRPAGGIICPGCRRASQRPTHPIVRIGHGAVALIGCQTHEEDVIDRYRTGRETRGQLNIDGPLSEPPHD
jgi:hypothetical protein